VSPSELARAGSAYLGDAVYATFEGDDLVLTTHDGHRETNRYLEPRVLAELMLFIKARGEVSP
jgi:hypothetical protein